MESTANREVVPLEYSEQLEVIAIPREPSEVPKEPTASRLSRGNAPSTFELFSYTGVPTGRRNTPDPLVASTFHAYHNYMERAEKRTQLSEREKHANDCGTYRDILQELSGADWKKMLLSVTAVQDPRDKAELEDKKKRTIHELEAYLNRAHEAREREKRLKNRLKELKEDPGVDDFSDSEETSSTAKYAYRYVYDLPEVEPKKEEEEPVEAAALPSQTKRKANEIKREAVKRAKMLLLEKKKKKPTPNKPFTSFFTSRQLQYRAKFDELIKKQSRTAQAFGQPVPKMKKTDFDLPAEILPTSKP